MNKRAITVAALTAAVVAAGVGTAFASQETGPITETTTGAHFYNGYSYFESPTTDGSWEYWGDLQDTTNDGHTPYMHAKIDGYAWNKEYGTANGTKYQDYAWYSPGDTYVEVAYLVACNDNGSLDPDNCSSTRTFNYNGS